MIHVHVQSPLSWWAYGIGRRADLLSRLFAANANHCYCSLAVGVPSSHQSPPPTEERAKSEAFSDAVSVVYTGSETADSYIEAATLVACRNAQRQVWAATSDFAQAKLAGAQGAHVISSRLFSAELTSARREARENAAAVDDIGEARGRAMLINTVEPSVRDALYKLRDQLDG